MTTTNAFQGTAHPQYSGFQYNTDLLLKQIDRDAAKLSFPEIYHVLDHPELRTHFEHWDNEANKAKLKLHTVGKAAIALGTASLLGAVISAAISASSGGSAEVPLLVRIAFGVLGLSSIFLALWVVPMHALRESWLHARTVTERLPHLVHG